MESVNEDRGGRGMMVIKKTMLLFSFFFFFFFLHLLRTIGLWGLCFGPFVLLYEWFTLLFLTTPWVFMNIL